MNEYSHTPYPHRSSQAAWHRREARRRKYLRRRLVALGLLALLIAGVAWGVRSLADWWLLRTERAAPSAAPAALAPKLPFVPEYYLNGVDLDGDGQVERVAVSRPDGGMRLVAVVAGEDRLIGDPLRLPAGTLAVLDLPRASRVLLWSGERPRTGEPQAVQVGGAKALLAQGGEPERRGYSLDGQVGLVPVDIYALMAPLAPPEPTVILVDKGLNLLWYYENGQLVQTARVATGRHIEGPAPSAANQKSNYLTPTGRFAISLRLPGMVYYRDQIPAGDPRNPLGTRWLGFNAFPGDGGRVWAIHGTNDPDRIGQWVTDGSIEMRNEQLEALYERVKAGTPLVVQNSLAAGR